MPSISAIVKMMSEKACNKNCVSRNNWTREFNLTNKRDENVSVLSYAMLCYGTHIIRHSRQDIRRLYHITFTLRNYTQLDSHRQHHQQQQRKRKNLTDYIVGWCDVMRWQSCRHKLIKNIIFVKANGVQHQQHIHLIIN